MTTSNIVPVVAIGHKCTCTEHRMLEAATSGFWNTPAGILHSIDGLSQDLMFKTVNNAVKMVAPTNNISWMQWVTSEDDKVCQKCIDASMGGNRGFYKVSWFMPKMPIHNKDRCQWALIMGDFTP